jgi:hypothetical protein
VSAFTGVARSIVNSSPAFGSDKCVVFGLDAPSETEVVAGLLGEPIDDDEFDIRFAGLQRSATRS